MKTSTANNSAYIPAPWYVVTSENDEDQFLETLNSNELGIAGKDSNGTQLYIAKILGGIDETNAHAALILGAPLLYEALKGLCAAWETLLPTLPLLINEPNYIKARDLMKTLSYSLP